MISPVLDIYLRTLRGCELECSSCDHHLQMSEPIRIDYGVGKWSAASAATIGVVFVVVGLLGVIFRPPGPDPLRQVDPYLAVLELLIILFAVALIVMMAAVYACAAPECKALALSSLSFIISFSVLTCSVHFASLTVGRNIDPAASPLLAHELSFAKWPTMALSLDLLAWDFFLGLGLVSAASTFKGKGATGRVRVSLIVAGSLCLAGFLGPVLGRLEIQILGIVGYAFALPVSCFLLAKLFSQGRDSELGFQ